jgi:HSP20 family protein
MSTLSISNQPAPNFFQDFGSRQIKKIADLLSRWDINVRQKHDGYQIEIAVPGLSKKDIIIKVDKNILSVSGNKQEEKKTLQRRTEFSARIERTFVLPADADTDRIQAKCRDGLLTIKIDIKPVRKRSISIAGIAGPMERMRGEWWTRGKREVINFFKGA